MEVLKAMRDSMAACVEVMDEVLAKRESNEDISEELQGKLIYRLFAMKSVAEKF